MKKGRLLLLLLVAVGASAEPIVRVVSANGSDKAFATEDVHKLVLTTDVVDVVNNAGSVLLSVPLAEIACVEFAEGIPTPTDVSQIQSDKVQCTKVLRDGQLYILYQGTMYNAQGQVKK